MADNENSETLPVNQIAEVPASPAEDSLPELLAPEEYVTSEEPVPRTLIKTESKISKPSIAPPIEETRKSKSSMTAKKDEISLNIPESAQTTTLKPTADLSKAGNPETSVKTADSGKSSTLSTNAGDTEAPKSVEEVPNPHEHSLTDEDLKNLSDHPDRLLASRLLPVEHNTGHSTHHPKRRRKKVPHDEIATQTYRDLNDSEDDMIKMNAPESGFCATFSPVDNFSGLPSDALCNGSILQPIPFHLQTYQSNYCYDTSQLRYLIMNVLKRLEKRHNKKIKLLKDIRWAMEEEKYQRRIADELACQYREISKQFENLQQKKKDSEKFCSERRMEEFYKRSGKIQSRLTKNVERKRKVMEDVMRCMDQTLNLYQKTLENVEDQWAQELTFLRGENAVLDAEYYRTQAAIRQTETDLTSSNDKVHSATTRLDTTCESTNNITTVTVGILRESRRDHALYYDQVLSLRAQCQKDMKSISNRTMKHFTQFDLQLAGICKGLHHVLGSLSKACKTREQVVAHPVVSCFVLSCCPMKMEVIKETVYQAQKEYRKLLKSIKRCKATKERQHDELLQKSQDYDVEESLLPRFRQQLFADTGGCSYPK